LHIYAEVSNFVDNTFSEDKSCSANKQSPRSHFSEPEFHYHVPENMLLIPTQSHTSQI